jgi:type III secretory pathway component EscU
MYIPITLITERRAWIEYITANLIGQKVKVATVVVAITEHLAVCLRIKLDAPLLHTGRGLFNMNTA